MRTGGKGKEWEMPTISGVLVAGVLACGAQIATWTAKTEKAEQQKRRPGAANKRHAFPVRAWRHEGWACSCVGS